MILLTVRRQSHANLPQTPTEEWNKPQGEQMKHTVMGPLSDGTYLVVTVQPGIEAAFEIEERKL